MHPFGKVGDARAELIWLEAAADTADGATADRLRRDDGRRRTGSGTIPAGGAAGCRAGFSEEHGRLSLDQRVASS